MDNPTQMNDNGKVFNKLDGETGDNVLVDNDDKGDGVDDEGPPNPVGVAGGKSKKARRNKSKSTRARQNKRKTKRVHRNKRKTKRVYRNNKKPTRVYRNKRRTRRV